MPALHDLGVAEAAKAIRNGEITAERLADALLARAAFIALEPDRVREAARKSDQQRASGASLGPLHGVPLALKDNLNTAELPTTGGTPGLAGNRPKRNAAIVDRLFAAGAIMLGKCNLHELAYGITNNNAAYGPARNPYALDRIPGASSGGTAVPWRRAWLRAASGRTPADRCASRRRSAGLSAFARQRAGGLKPVSCRFRIHAIRPAQSRAASPTARCWMAW